MNDHDFLDVGEAALTYRAVGAEVERPPMVDFRGHDGRSLAVPYTTLTSLTLEEGNGIALEFTEYRIGVRGRNLRPLYDALVQHRVVFIQEGDLDFVSESEPFVDSIVIAPRDIEVEPLAPS